jgi:hypothetical protein
MAQATVDRIEGDFAVLILCNGEITTLTLPSALLPDGCREGDIVSLTLERDPRATQTARNRVAETIERLQKR